MQINKNRKKFILLPRYLDNKMLSELTQEIQTHLKKTLKIL